MKRLLLVFLIMVAYNTHAQDNQDIDDLADETNNTLEVLAFLWLLRGPVTVSRRY